jgi:TonB family protein
MPEPVSCEHFEELAVLYALGELEPGMRAAVEEHAGACDACAARLRQEIALAEILAADSRPAAEESSDLLLSRCRKEFTGTLDQIEAASRPRAWLGVLPPRGWLASFRVSPRFHPAWSAAALAFVAALSGLAGWEGIGQAPLQHWGPALMTVSAAPPSPPAPAPPDSTTSKPAQETPVAAVPAAPAPASTPAEDLHIYSATDAAIGGSPSARSLDTGDAPRWRHMPPPRLSPGLTASEIWEAPDSGHFAELSRQMETLWWGGVRIDPAEQQKRLIRAPSPEYPEVARRAGIEGPVTLLLRINRDGSVEDSELLSGEPILGRAAAEAVQQWRYSPLRMSGRPVNILTSVTFDFQLR